MAVSLAGNYFLRILLGDTTIPILPTSIQRLTITQDLNRFLPTLRLTTDDPQGVLSHLVPLDNQGSNIFIEIGKTYDDTENFNSFDFKVFRAFPSSESTISSTFDVSGLHNIGDFFVANKSRSFNQNISTALSYIAMSEMEVDSTEISTSLNYPKTLIQPYVSNSAFIYDLQRRLQGSGGQYSFCPFVKRYKGRSVFVFKSIDELVSAEPVYRFIINDEPFGDRIPALNYKVYNNYRALGILGSKKQEFAYFNYDLGKYVIDTMDYSDYLSMSEFFMIDQSDSEESNSLVGNERSNDFTADFKDEVKSTYYRRLTGLVKMWMVVWGLENIVPGQSVDVLFGGGLDSGSLLSYQYSGNWLVERVVHNFGKTFLTTLLLTRNGVDTDKGTSLVRAVKVKR